MHEFDYHNLDEKYAEDYGIAWPAKTPQIVKELKCFSMARFEGRRIGTMGDAYHHLMCAIRLNWPERLKVAVDIGGRRYENTFFSAVIHGLCDSNEVMLTGPASAGKTCPVAAYNLCAFYANPNRTTALISTTSIKGADMRLWGEIRDLHMSAKFKVGYVLESVKAITFDKGFETRGERGSQERDLRNSLTVVAIPAGAEGRGAVRSIIGTKNEIVIWSIDELPEMSDGLLGDATANLESNPFFQLNGIGNAKPGNNPHRSACEPEGGWDGHNPHTTPYGGLWTTKTGGLCVFLDGHKSPNCAPEFSDSPKSALPFQFLSNPIANKRNAERFGQGDIEAGMRTLSYFRMNRGIWPEGDVESTVLTKTKVMRTGCNKDVTSWTADARKTYAGCDPAFATGGDGFIVCFGERGREITGKEVLRVDSEGIRIEIDAESKQEYAKSAAVATVAALKRRGVEPRDFGIDVSSDGGIIAQAIMQEWGSTEIKLISSQGKPTNLPISVVDPRPAHEVYDRRVSELWLSLGVAVDLGIIRNYNCFSRYARDHFTRQFETVSGGRLSIETKPDFKSANGRSPDDGDAFVYLWDMVRNDGIELTSISASEPVVTDGDWSGIRPAGRDAWEMEDDSYGYLVSGRDGFSY